MGTRRCISRLMFSYYAFNYQFKERYGTLMSNEPLLSIQRENGLILNSWLRNALS